MNSAVCGGVGVSLGIGTRECVLPAAFLTATSPPPPGLPHLTGICSHSPTYPILSFRKRHDIPKGT